MSGGQWFVLVFAYTVGAGLMVTWPAVIALDRARYDNAASALICALFWPLLWLMTPGWLVLRVMGHKR